MLRVWKAFLLTFYVTGLMAGSVLMSGMIDLSLGEYREARNDLISAKALPLSPSESTRLANVLMRRQESIIGCTEALLLQTHEAAIVHVPNLGSSLPSSDGNYQPRMLVMRGPLLSEQGQNLLQLPGLDPSDLNWLSPVQRARLWQNDAKICTLLSELSALSQRGKVIAPGRPPVASQAVSACLHLRAVEMQLKQQQCELAVFWDPIMRWDGAMLLEQLSFLIHQSLHRLGNTLVRARELLVALKEHLLPTMLEGGVEPSWAHSVGSMVLSFDVRLFADYLCQLLYYLMRISKQLTPQGRTAFSPLFNFFAEVDTIGSASLAIYTLLQTQYRSVVIASSVQGQRERAAYLMVYDQMRRLLEWEAISLGVAWELVDATILSQLRQRLTGVPFREAYQFLAQTPSVSGFISLPALLDALVQRLGTPSDRLGRLAHEVGQFAIMDAISWGPGEAVRGLLAERMDIQEAIINPLWRRKADLDLYFALGSDSLGIRAQLILLRNLLGLLGEIDDSLLILARRLPDPSLSSHYQTLLLLGRTQLNDLLGALGNIIN